MDGYWEPHRYLCRTSWTSWSVSTLVVTAGSATMVMIILAVCTFRNKKRWAGSSNRCNYAFHRNSGPQDTQDPFVHPLTCHMTIPLTSELLNMKRFKSCKSQRAQCTWLGSRLHVHPVPCVRCPWSCLILKCDIILMTQDWMNCHSGVCS